MRPKNEPEFLKTSSIVLTLISIITVHSSYLIILSQRTPHTETNILPIITPFSDIGKQLTAIIQRNQHIVENDTTLSTIWPSKPLAAYTKSNNIHNHLVRSAQTCGFSQQDSQHHYPHTPTYTNTDIPTIIYP